MNKIIFVLVGFLMCISNTIHSQYVLKDQEDVRWYEGLPQEDIYISYNASMVFAGESLYYKVYCSNSRTKYLSKNSKIAYVELIGAEGPVFRHRIRLKNGIGQGDFFVPVNVRTGNYKLIGYTRWMLNRKDKGFYQADISIINPYAKLSFSQDQQSSRERNPDVSNDIVQLNVSSGSLDKREPVDVVVESLDVKALGNYSVSIRKTGDIAINNHVDKYRTDTTNNFVAINQEKAVGETIYLPEFKGEMLTGVVTDKATGSPASNVEVGLSILSKEAIQDVTKTNSKGMYYFQISDNYSTPRALIQVLGDDREMYDLQVDDFNPIDYTSFNFSELKLDSRHKEAIIKRSVNNQIENAYVSVKQDKTVSPNFPKPFYGNPMTTYILDDYKRFLNVAETLDEVVDHAYHERRNGKTRYINVRERETDPYYDVDILPMVVVDGASIQDHQGLLSFETKDVESMSVLRQEYYYGDKVYQGVLMINTFNGDYYKNLKGDHLKIVELNQPQLETIYFQPDYSEKKKYERIPDQRDQLLWVPELELNEQRKHIRFYTSDNSGQYEITLNGLTNEGKPVETKKTITVN